MIFQILTIIVFILAVLFILFIAFWKLYFLRNPERIPPKGKNIISPADGKIISIIPIKKERIKIKKRKIGKINALVKDTLKEGYLISIFMSLFDVHVNRAPVDGKIISTKHTRGKFLPAYNLDALENEKNEIIIKNKILGKIKVIQVAGFIARRIRCYVKKNQKIIKGERIGLINMGSQVTLIVPKNIKLKIKKGQKVKAGKTILATY
ncbi:phosphatidylserine decarboxylase, partial [Candidatus Woesearchaeota archaeon]|nr:phosphatidylserine decarboxylase [Candidatus Woesearchaeota archaeon]